MCHLRMGPHRSPSPPLSSLLPASAPYRPQVFERAVGKHSEVDFAIRRDGATALHVSVEEHHLEAGAWSPRATSAFAAREGRRHSVRGTRLQVRGG